jgi:hypothetical protein
MTQVKLLAAAATLALSAAAFAETPVAAAEAVDNGSAAIEACAAFNKYAPATPIAAVQDGMGDWLIWLKDKDEDLWMCNANGAGNVYANVLIQGDLLSGDGAGLSAYEPAASGINAPGPAARAERLCAAIGSMSEPMTIVATVSDGMGDYLIWLKTGHESFYVCNASAEAELYVFEAVQYPLNESGSKPAVANPNERSA